MRYAPGAVVIFAIGMASVAEADYGFTVVLHARTGIGSGSCTESDVPNCYNVHPRIQVAPGERFRLYILVNNYTEFQSFQTCLIWPDDWVFNPDGEVPFSFPCTANTLLGHEPQGNGDSAVDGTFAASFDCITGPAIAKIVRIDFQAGQGGCLIQINPAQGSQRVEIDDCATDPPGGNPSYIDASTAQGRLHLGSICVGMQGFDACYPRDGTAVEPATCGRIKASYR